MNRRTAPFILPPQPCGGGVPESRSGGNQLA